MMKPELHDLEQRALRSAAKATSLVRKLVANSPHASLEALEQQIAELRVVRSELADRTGRSALE